MRAAGDAARALVLAAALATSAVGCAKDRPGAVPVDRGETRSAEMPVPTPDRGLACGPRGLPPDRHYIAEGLCARVVAYGQGKLRGITFAPNGDLLTVTTDGEIRRYRDVDHDGLFSPEPPETIVWAKTGGDNGHNCHLDGQDLYCGSKGRVKRWRYSSDSERGGDGEDVVSGIPEGGLYSRLPVGVWDGFLYVASGAAANLIEPMPADYDTNRGVLKRFTLSKYVPAHPLQWKDGELFARGLRNLTAFARDARGRLYGIDNAIDDLKYRDRDVHEDNPGEPVVVLERGRAFGWPFCFYAQRITEDAHVVPAGTPLAVDVRGNTKDDAWCAANVAPVATLLQAHSSALAIAFVEGDGKAALPPHFRSGAFVSLHGSSDREHSTGHKVIWIPTEQAGADGMPMPTSTRDGAIFPYEVVFGGGRDGVHRDGEWSWKVGDATDDPVRPVGVAISPADGALYVTTDGGGGLGAGGAIYRIALLGR